LTAACIRISVLPLPPTPHTSTVRQGWHLSRYFAVVKTHSSDDSQ
jgi:hypothetical protein